METNSLRIWKCNMYACIRDGMVAVLSMEKKLVGMEIRWMFVTFSEWLIEYILNGIGTTIKGLWRLILPCMLHEISNIKNIAATFCIVYRTACAHCVLCDMNRIFTDRIKFIFRILNPDHCQIGFDFPKMRSSFRSFVC